MGVFRGAMCLYLTFVVGYWGYHTLMVDDDAESKVLHRRYESFVHLARQLSIFKGVHIPGDVQFRVRRWMIMRTFAFTAVISLGVGLLLCGRKHLLLRGVRGLARLVLSLAMLGLGLLHLSTAADKFHTGCLDHVWVCPDLTFTADQGEE